MHGDKTVQLQNAQRAHKLLMQSAQFAELVFQRWKQPLLQDRAKHLAERVE
jgi:hypothetical protein